MDPERGRFAASLIDASLRVWASNCAWRMGETQPSVSGALLAAGPGGWRPHFDSLLQHLSAALHFDAPALFVEQAVWMRVAFESRGIDPALLSASLAAMRDELSERLPANAAPEVMSLLAQATAECARALAAPVNALTGAEPATALAREYLFAALEGRRDDAIALVMGALDRGMSVEQLMRDVLGRAQNELGSMWHRSELSIVEEHMVSRTTESALMRLQARLPHAPSNGLRVLVTSVDGDIHDIGLRVVASQFEMAGWNAIFLGASTPPAEAAMAAAEFEVQLVAVGAKLVPHLRSAAELMQLLRADPRTRAIPVIFGGRPFELAPQLWRALGADGSASSAAEAVELAARLVAGHGEAR